MSEMYQLKITLGKYKPPIWRRMIVDPNMSLKQLHLLIQIIFNWSNSHLHKFETVPPKPTREQRDAYYSDMFHFREPSVDIMPKRIKDSELIKNHLTKIKEKLKYTYDLGDPWDHWIELEKTIPREDGKTYPYCVTGRCMALKEHIDEYDDPHYYDKVMNKELIDRNIQANIHFFSDEAQIPHDIREFGESEGFDLLDN